jgi:hypothetical protein
MVLNGTRYSIVLPCQRVPGDLSGTARRLMQPHLISLVMSLSLFLSVIIRFGSARFFVPAIVIST